MKVAREKIKIVDTFAKRIDDKGETIWGTGAEVIVMTTLDRAWATGNVSPMTQRKVFQKFNWGN